MLIEIKDNVSAHVKWLLIRVKLAMEIAANFPLCKRMWDGSLLHGTRRLHATQGAERCYILGIYGRWSCEFSFHLSCNVILSHSQRSERIATSVLARYFTPIHFSHFAAFT